jgi:hypothetical protein
VTLARDEFLRVNATVAQAIALLIAVAFTSAFHHIVARIFTYRAQHPR